MFVYFIGDIDVKRVEIVGKLIEFDREFVILLFERCKRLLVVGDDASRDVAIVLLVNEDQLHLFYEVIVREVAFYLFVGVYILAIVFIRVTHNIFIWLGVYFEYAELVRFDWLFVQRCAHETVWLQFFFLVAMRWVFEDVVLRLGRRVFKGAKVVIDLLVVNWDLLVFGADVEVFDFICTLLDGVAFYGLFFGFGMYVCIGQDLVVGFVYDPVELLECHVFGFVLEVVQVLFDQGVCLDFDDLFVMDASMIWLYFGCYLVCFG